MSSATWPLTAKISRRPSRSKSKKKQEKVSVRSETFPMVDEEAIALVRIERHHLVREVADDQTRTARAVVIGGVDAHPCSCNPRFVERDARGHPDVHERPVSTVAIEAVRLRVVGYEQIRV